MDHPSPLIGRQSQSFGIRLVTLEDGPGRGVRLLQGWTEAGLSFEIVVDRGFDIGDARLGARALAFHGPGGIRAPGLYDPHGTEAWLRGFTGGLLMTGGLDHVGGGAEDDASRFAYPGRDRETFPLHGRLTGEPATLRAYGAEDGRLWAEAEVDQAMLYGERLRLIRRIEAEDTTITVTDQVTNLGRATNPVPMLYHCNLGWPLLAPGGRLHLEAEEVRACGEFDTEGWNRVPEPRDGFVEEVLEIRPKIRSGRAESLLVNADRDLALRQSWDAREMPWLYLWRQFAPCTFVMGVEPSNVPALSRADLSERDLMPTLEPGQSRTTSLSLTAFGGARAREAAEKVEMS
ncbi:DUF4432 family protein [Jannaschia aquimarina]|uniref:Aldose 1-epimerase n=1 Tax=Jannaschia aquimarina TaxID=935700 RepID=A0A0D1CJQ2_9RHOB|nr:DUF4432 family protein [Jannaschia aquimarina]KIT14952.1 hypothetical protein jaqu_32770 [Jannaschia aquimarina]SNS60273.1 protein of unknown function [Jannaschia aquimarina]